MTSHVPTGHTTFCDDIRLEVGGKVTLVGVYSGVMYIHGNFPYTAPKLGLRVLYNERLDTLGKERVTLRVTATWDETPLINQEIPISQISADKISGDILDLPPPNLGIVGMHVMFTPLVIPEPGVIKVRAYRGDQKIRLGALRIGKAPAPPGQSDDSKV